MYLLSSLPLIHPNQIVNLKLRKIWQYFDRFKKSLLEKRIIIFIVYSSEKTFPFENASEYRSFERAQRFLKMSRVILRYSGIFYIGQLFNRVFLRHKM